jgi:hypothetical protein
MPKRATIAHFIDEHELQWEIAMGVLTVKNHVSTILGNLEVARRTEAAAYLATRTSSFG